MEHVGVDVNGVPCFQDDPPVGKLELDGAGKDEDELLADVFKKLIGLEFEGGDT